MMHSQSLNAWHGCWKRRLNAAEEVPLIGKPRERKRGTLSPGWSFTLAKMTPLQHMPHWRQRSSARGAGLVMVEFKTVTNDRSGLAPRQVSRTGDAIYRVIMRHWNFRH